MQGGVWQMVQKRNKSRAEEAILSSCGGWEALEERYELGCENV